MIMCNFAIVDGEQINLTDLPAMRLGEGVNSDTIRERTARIIDMDDLRRRVAPERIVDVGEDERQPKSGLYVPMISGDRVIGVMNAQSYETDAFRHTDLTLLATLASY